MKKLAPLIIVLSFLIAGYAYQAIPDERVASHWDQDGEVNGTLSKFWGVFLIPIMLVGLYALFLLIPRIDPLKKNIKEFSKYYDWFVLGFFLYMLYIHLLTILANLGFSFNMTIMVMPAVAILFIGIGVFLRKLKRNWFIGIRTPWTISNDRVWKKTHELGSKLFILIGAILLLMTFFPTYLFWTLIGSIFAVVAILTAYSYILYRQLEK